MATYSSVKQAVADAAGVGGSVTTYSTPANLPTSGNEAGDQAFVSSNNRLYIWNGSGWYNIALINTSPSFSSSPDGSYVLNTDGTPTTITLVATDPEGLDITYTTTTDAGFDGLATVSNDSSVFTITPLSADSSTTTSGNLTFKASDGVNLVSAISEFTLQLSIDNSASTALLAKASGNAGTNAAFPTDNSSNNYTVSNGGSTTPINASLTPFHPGGYSAYFDGTGDSLQLTTSGDLQAIGRSSAAATIEAWVFLNSAPSSSGTAVYSQGTAGSTSGSNIISFEIQNNRTLRAMVNGGYSNTSGCPISTGTVPLQEWTHIALVLNSGTWTTYINGTADGTASGSYPSGTAHSTAYIGRIFYDAGRTGDMYIRDLRITSTAVYTSAFTPPDEKLTAITNTKLLACHLPYIGDGSTSNYTITANGDAFPERFSPYDYPAYSASSHGSSVYIYDKESSLVVENGSSMSTTSYAGDFTYEGWFWLPSAGGFPSRTIFSDDQNADSSNRGIYWLNNRYYYSTAASPSSWAGAPDFYASSADVFHKGWNHIALVRDGDTLRPFVNGQPGETDSLSTGVALNFPNRAMALGRYNNNSQTDFYVAEFRIVKGTAVYTSAFTPPTAPLSAISGTEVLVRPTAPKIFDAAGQSNLTLYGNTQSSTAQTKNASSSIYFDGSNDYVSVTNSSLNGTGNFTLEYWIYMNSTSSFAIIGDMNISGNGGWQVWWNSSVGQFRIGNNNLTDYEGYAFTNQTGQWYHHAWVRNGSTLSFFIDGAQITRTTNAGNMGTTDLADQTSRIGIFNDDSHDFNGYIEDLRITEGLARYTGTFTPPTSELTG